MPTNDQNSNGIGSIPASTDSNTADSQDISDLGDILMEKTLDATQGSDFVGVKSSDVDLLTNLSDSVVKPDDVGSTNIAAEQSPESATPTSEPIDLGDISLEDLTTPIVATPAPVVEEKHVDLNAIESISIPESTPVTINQEDTSTNIPSVTTPTVDAAPVSDTSLETLSSELTPEIAPTQVPETEVVPDNAPMIEQPQIETAPIVESTPIIESIPVAESFSIPEAVTTTPVTEAVQEEVVAPVVEQTQPEQVVNNLPEIVSTPQTNIEEKIAEVQAASQEIEGLDLDSLVAQSNTADAVSTTPVVKTEPMPTAVPMNAAPKNNKKQMGLILGVLGVIAVAGLGYFGYKTMYPVGVDGPAQTGSSEQDTGGMPMIVTGDVFAETGNDIMSGNTDTGSNADSGSISTGDVATGTDTGNTVDNSPVISYDSIVQSGNDLASRVRKLLIKATIDKNGPARITAFGIQKDIEAFQQALEKTTDISTLSNVTGVIAGFSQRLDSLAQKLDGTSNQ